MLPLGVMRKIDIMKHIIVIDDSGSPGSLNESRFLKSNRKTLVGVFIRSDHRKFHEQQIKAVISDLRNRFGITELHFTDIVNGVNEWSSIPIDYRLSIVSASSNWFSIFPLPYIVQTCNEKTFEENGIFLKGKLGNFDFSK